MAFIGLTIFASSIAGAATVTWTGGNSTWSNNDANSFSATYTNGDDVVFNDTVSGTIRVSGTLSPGSILFNNTAALTFSNPAGTQPNDGNNWNGGGPVTINGPVNFITNDMLPFRSRVTINSGGDLNYANGEVIGSLTGSGTIRNTFGNTNLRLGTDGTDFTFSGVMNLAGGGGGVFSKVGRGTMTWAGDAETKGLYVLDGRVVNTAGVDFRGLAMPGGVFEIDRRTNNGGTGFTQNTISGGEFIFRGNTTVSSPISSNAVNAGGGGQPGADDRARNRSQCLGGKSPQRVLLQHHRRQRTARPG